jgi:penicillin-binding protein 2
MFGRRPWHDHVKAGHGAVTVYEALERSCNIFFYRMGISLGIDRMHKYIAPFGLGVRTGVDLNREATGLMPSDEWKRKEKGEPWQPGENLSVAIGGGFVSVTPLQLAVGYNAIGTEGKVVRPFILKEIQSLDGKTRKTVEPTVLRDLQQVQPNGMKIDAETFKVVKEGLRRVVQGSRGTAVRMRIPGVEIAGKTGTAQVRGWSASEIHQKCENQPLRNRHHGWFIAYAPADNPEVAVAVLAEHSCHGGSGAGVVAKDMFQAYFQKYHPEMIKAAEKKPGANVVPAGAIEE